MSSVGASQKGAGATFLWSPSTEKPVLTQPLAGQTFPLTETSEQGDSISGFLIRLGKVDVTERCKGRMKGMVQKGLIMWEKVFSNFCWCDAFFRELRL